MAEDSRPWGGIVTGDAGPYSEDQWGAIYRTMLGITAKAPTNLSGVSRSELNELVVTGAATPLSVASGRAMVHGTWYESTAAVSVAVAVPAGATRIDRIVLRKDWTLQTIRVFRIAGVEGGGAPALVQTDGVTWDMPLIQVSVTTGGAYTITDERQFIPTPGLVLEGSNTSEATTTSVAGVDILSVTGLNIPVNTPIFVMASFRKTVGAAARASIGLKLNATQVFSNKLNWPSVNEVRSSVKMLWINSRTANYLRAGIGFNTEVAGQSDIHEADADAPTVPITDVVITGLTSDALVTVGVTDLRVYTLAV